MKLKVKKYCGVPFMYHECIDTEGQEQRVDLLVNGDLPYRVDPELLVGKTVEVQRLHPAVEIAFGVKIVKEKNEANQCT